MRNIPNYITVGRLLTLPILVALMMADTFWTSWLALGIYTFGCITDWLDGYIARRYKVVSPFGQFLDPIADKIFILTVLITLIANHHVQGMWIVPIILILSREFLIAGLREFLGPKNIQIPVTQLAKWKTGFQMGSLGFLIVGEHGKIIYPIAIETGLFLLLVATALTIITGWGYFREGLKHVEQP